MVAYNWSSDETDRVMKVASGALYKPILLQTACSNLMSQVLTDHCNPKVSTQQSPVGVELNNPGEPKYVALEPSLQTLSPCRSPIQASCPVKKVATNLFSSSFLIETKSLLIFRHAALASLQFFPTVKLIVL